MFGRTIWNKLPKCKNCPNQTCDYWLITPNKNTLCIEINSFKSDNYKITPLTVQFRLLSSVWLVLVITYLREKFVINLPSSLFWNSEISREKRVKILRINMWFLVNHMWQALKEHIRVRITQETININKFNKPNAMTPTRQ